MFFFKYSVSPNKLASLTRINDACASIKDIIKANKLMLWTALSYNPMDNSRKKVAYFACCYGICNQTDLKIEPVHEISNNVACVTS